MRRIVAFAVLGTFTLLAHGQMGPLRTIPAEAKVAAIKHVEGMDITLDGEAQRLSPGAQVRDEANRIIVPVQIPPGVQVKYLLDGEGQVRQVWILTDDEKPPAVPPPQPPSPQQ
jgi:hypothetical protein